MYLRFTELHRKRKQGTVGGQVKRAVLQMFRHSDILILPQAIRHALPVYKGEFISMMKATSVVGYIAVQDITQGK
jgi:polar amino acid transport system substrate-binding protein